MTTPKTELDQRYSDPDAAPVSWADAAAYLATAELSWISTVRPDGRPHVTPLGTVLHDGSLHFSTGAEERKGLNLASNPFVVLTTGTNTINEGLDVVVEGEAVRVTDDARLGELAEAWEQKYGADWHFDAGDGVFHHPEGTGVALVFEVRATTGFAFGKAPHSQTRWRFGA